MIEISSKGSSGATEKWLRSLVADDAFRSLERFGREGVNALRAATPKDSGDTASQWYYEIVRDGKSYSIVWGNSHIQDGQLIAVLLQHGHGTRNGGWVQGEDYINPALRPIFDQIAAEAWKAVTAK